MHTCPAISITLSTELDLLLVVPHCGEIMLHRVENSRSDVTSGMVEAISLASVQAAVCYSAM